MAKTKARAPTDIRDVQVIKHDRAFFLSDRYGDVPEDNRAALGLYFNDTRFLSRLELSLNDLAPLLLHSSTERNYSQIVELGYTVSAEGPARFDRRENVSLSRHRLLSDSLLERVKVSSFSASTQLIRLSIAFDADFLDLFEVRGFTRERSGELKEPRVDGDTVRFEYVGADDIVRRTTLAFSPTPKELGEQEAVFEFDLDPKASVTVGVTITPSVGDSTPPAVTTFKDARQELEHEYSQWRRRCTRFRTPNVPLQSFLDRAVLDLRMLLSRDDRGTEYIDAGVPWFSALFGRDSLITAYQCLGVIPDLAWGVLRGLAALQGTKEDDWREEEPGKILHEVRVGELARTGEIPHTPYYGSIDATPLWLVLLTYAYAWTGDLEAVKELWPNALAALEWIDRYGDRDGDGYVEYQKRSEKGLDNQGWKDSWDAVIRPDGTLAEPPIALVEVQGYVYQAKTRMARLAVAVGDHDLAARLAGEAQELKERFNRDYWMADQGYYALALDGKKRQVTTITSNPGHCLWSQIVDEDKASRVARRLLSPEVSSGWGVRTLAAGQRPFDPLGYHRGSVWPHDNALIAHGLKLYGFDEEAMRIIDQLVLAGTYFSLARYPELFCGFSREEVPVPVEYPVACRPQAWSSGAALLMLRSYAGISAEAPEGELNIVRPELPAWLDEIEIIGMRVGESRVDLRFTAHDGVTSVQVPRKEGDVEVLIRH